MRYGSLFTGAGGWDLAAEWMGWINIFYCENNEFCRKVLKYYWPKSIGYGDIKQTDFTIHRGQIDILTGSFPCQGFSIAGKRKGVQDDRYLWPEMLRAVREIKPPWVVAENVGGIISSDGGMVFEQVQADLEAEGYEVQSFILPAAGIEAPHRRDRVWFMAYTGSKQLQTWSQNNIEENKEKDGAWMDDRIERQSDTWPSPNDNIGDREEERLQAGRQEHVDSLDGTEIIAPTGLQRQKISS